MKRGVALLIAGALLTVPGSAGAATFSATEDENGAGIQFTNGPANIGSVYPSTITAPAGTVNDVNVRLFFTHQFPDDLDIALVSPNGTPVMLMSDACGDDPLFHDVTFDDAAAQNLQNTLDCDQDLVTAPQDFDDMGDPDIDFPPPAPALPTQTGPLAGFNGGPSGGAWSLFAVDDFNASGGIISQWTLTLDFTPAPVVQTPVVPVQPIVTPPTPGVACPKGKKLKNGKCVKKKKKKKPKKK